MKKDLATELHRIIHTLAPGHEVLERISDGGKKMWLRWIARAALSGTSGAVSLSSYADCLPLEGDAETPLGFSNTTSYLAPDADGAPRITRPSVEPPTFSYRVDVSIAVNRDKAAVSITQAGRTTQQAVPFVYTDGVYILNVEWPATSGIHGNIRLPDAVVAVDFSINIIPQYPLAAMVKQLAADNDTITMMEKYGTIDLFYFSDTPEESLTAAVLAVLRMQEGGVA